MASTRRRSVLGVAAGGVLLGHAITYALADPSAYQRTTDLARTGHGYLGLANDLGLVAALIALSAVFLGGLTRGHGDAPTLRGLTARLAVFQVVAFASMELLERLAAGAPVASVPHHGILPLGMGAQVAIAALGALIIRWLLRAADRVESGLGLAPDPVRPRDRGGHRLHVPRPRAPRPRRVRDKRPPPPGLPPMVRIARDAGPIRTTSRRNP